MKAIGAPREAIGRPSPGNIVTVTPKTLLQVRPLVHGELRHWIDRASKIPDTELRRRVGKNNRCFGTTVWQVGGWIVPRSAMTADILHKTVAEP